MCLVYYYIIRFTKLKQLDIMSHLKALGITQQDLGGMFKSTASPAPSRRDRDAAQVAAQAAVQPADHHPKSVSVVTTTVSVLPNGRTRFQSSRTDPDSGRPMKTIDSLGPLFGHGRLY